MKLGLCDRNPELLAETEKMLSGEGVEVLTAVLDVRDEAQLGDFFGRVDESFGEQLDVLVNVVGGLVARKTLAEMDEEFFDYLLKLNVTSTFLTLFGRSARKTENKRGCKPWILSWYTTRR